MLALVIKWLAFWFCSFVKVVELQVRIGVSIAAVVVEAKPSWGVPDLACSCTCTGRYQNIFLLHSYLDGRSLGSHLRRNLGRSFAGDLLFAFILTWSMSRVPPGIPFHSSLIIACQCLGSGQRRQFARTTVVAKILTPSDGHLYSA